MLCRDVHKRSRNHAQSAWSAVFSSVVNKQVPDLENAGVLHIILVRQGAANVYSETCLTSILLSQVTYCEVYCEVLRDLLSEQQPARLAGAGHNKKGQTGIDVMEANGVMKLKGVTPIEVKSMEVIFDILGRIFIGRHCRCIGVSWTHTASELRSGLIDRWQVPSMRLAVLFPGGGGSD